MSVNLNISLEIHDFNPEKKEELYETAKQLLTEEDLLEEGMKLEFLGEKGYLAAYTTYPIIISGSYKWEKEITKKWEEMALRVNGEPCNIGVDIDSPDDEY